MRARDDDLRTARGAADLHHIHADDVAFFIMLAAHLLGRSQHGVGLILPAADAHDHVARRGLDAQDRCGEDLMLLGRERVKDHAALSLADALDDDLLGGLRGDAPERLRFDLGVHKVAELGVGADFPRRVERDFGGGGDDVVHDLFLDVEPHIAVGNIDEHIIGVAFLILFIRGDQRLRDLVDHICLRNAPLLFELRQCGKNFGVHFSSILLVKNPHEAAPWRPRFFQIAASLPGSRCSPRRLHSRAACPCAPLRRFWRNRAAP